MIAFIRGIVQYKEDGLVVIDRDGIGFNIRVPDQVVRETVTGNELTLHTCMQVREDDISLFGFASRKELSLFRILLGISGVGPKAALSLLSTLGPEELYYAVFGDDVKAISRTPGIGPKGARRIILELKDKLDINEISMSSDMSADGTDLISSQADPAFQAAYSDAAQALQALGFSSSDAYRALRMIPDSDGMDAGTLIREALRHLG